MTLVERLASRQRCYMTRGYDAGMFEKVLDLYNRLSRKDKAALLGVAVLAAVAAFVYALQFKLSDIKDAAEASSAFFTAIAFIVGGILAYLLFVLQLQWYPRAVF